MLLEAILGIIAISVVFCCCTLCCYVVFHYIFTEEKADVQPETEVWEAKHFYDPLPMATPSPPDTIFKPTPYTFKLQNGNGVYSSGLPHAVINPAVLQYPPGHVYDQQRVHQPAPIPPAQVISTRREIKVKEREPSQRRKQSKSKSRSRSRSPSPHRSPRITQNVWSTNTDFQQTYTYHPNNHIQQHQHSQQLNRHHHHQQQQQHPHSQSQNLHQSQPYQKQYVQLTQEHYPLQEYNRQRQQQQQQQYENQYPEEYYPDDHQHRQHNNNHHHHSSNHEHRSDRQQHHKLQRQHSQQFQAFMATTHATNLYTPSTQRKLYRSPTRFKEDVT